MYSISSKIVFPEKFLEFFHNDNYVIVNPEICSSIRLSKEEYELLKLIEEKREKSMSDCQHFIDADEAVYKLILRFILAKVILMEKEKVIQYNDAKPNYYAVYWGLTEKCNFRCLYCYAKCGPEVKEREDSYLSIEQCYRVVDEIAGMGFKILNLTGGEPLLNENAFRIAKYAKGLGLKCGMLTNGSLINKKNIQKFKIFDYVKISLDSNLSEINDITRGKGTYDRIIKALDLLNANNITTMIGSVITKYNKENISDFIKFIDDNYSVVSHSLANFIPTGRGKENEIGCSHEELKILNSEVLRTKREIHKSDLGIVSQDVFLSDSRKTSCGMAMGEIFINYKADVYPCRMTYSPEYYLGNVLQAGLKKTLDNADHYREQFNINHLECKACEYKYLCGGGCRMYHGSRSGSPSKNNSEVCDEYKEQIKNLLLVKHGIM